MDFTNCTLTSARDLLLKKEVTSVDLVQASLDRIHNIDKELNACLFIDSDGALAKAKESDSRYQNGSQTKLDGLPIGYKDAFTTRGVPTTAASKVLEGYIPPFSATAVERLDESGAIGVVKTNMDAWAHGSSGENSDFGPAKNPYDLSRTPGGSSSGSAAAVASGEVLAATGTDTGGSIRLPAAFTNTVGLKPTYGRVSRYGIVAMGSSFDCIGHITKTVADSALMLEVTAGFDPHDATSSRTPVLEYTKYLGQSIQGMKVGVIKEFLTDGIDDGVREVFEKSLELLKSNGCEIIEVSLKNILDSMAVYYVLVPAEVSSNLARYTGVRYGPDRSHFSPEAKRRIMTGTFTLSSGYYDAYYGTASKVRRLIRDDFVNAFKDVDILVAPTSPTVPFKLGEKSADPLQMYLSDIFVCPMNLAGVPAISVPAGAVDGLPVGIQFIAPHFAEEKLFTIGSAFEKERGQIKNLQIVV